MRLHVALATLLLCAGGVAHALDIPMDPRLAETALDSKTCYGELTSRGKLVGYEMGEVLLASSGGALVTLPAGSMAQVGDRQARFYAGESVRVAVVPRQTRRRVPTPDVEEIREKATVTIAERGGRSTLQADVRFTCSP